MLLCNTGLPSLVVIVIGSVDIWTKLLKTVNWRPETASSLTMDLDGELVIVPNYRKTLFALRIHTPNAWNALICLMGF